MNHLRKHRWERHVTRDPRQLGSHGPATARDCRTPCRRSRADLLLAVLGALLASGCSLLPPKSDTDSDTVELRRQRNAQAVHQFEENRTAAELIAAQSRYDQGDLPGCRAALERILLRTPDQPEARLLLAQVTADQLEPTSSAAGGCSPIQQLLTQGNGMAGPCTANVPVAPGANPVFPTARASAAVVPQAEADERKTPVVETAGSPAKPKAPPAELPGDVIKREIPAIGTYTQGITAQPDVRKTTDDFAAKEPAEKITRSLRPDHDDCAKVEERADLGPPQPPIAPPDGQTVQVRHTVADRQPNQAQPIAPDAPTAPASQPSPLPGAAQTEIRPAAPQTQTVEGYLALCEEALRREDDDTAWTHIRAAALLRRQDPQIPTTASILALRYNRPQLAAEVLSDAARQFPKSAAIHRTLGTAYYRLGDYKSSQVALQQALSLDKSSALTYFLMGCTLAKLGRPEAAESQFRQASLLDPRYAIQR